MTEPDADTLEDRLPSWMTEIDLLRRAATHFLVDGNVGDLSLVPSQQLAEPGYPSVEFSDFNSAVDTHLGCIGVEDIIHYDPVHGAIVSAEEMEGWLDRVGTEPADLAPPGQLRGLADLINEVLIAPEPTALVIHGASRLAADVSRLSDDEFEFFRRVDLLARVASPPDGVTFNPILWLLDSIRDVPGWFSIGNPTVRQVTIPLPDADERLAAARLWVRQLAGGTSDDDELVIADAFRRHAAGLALREMRAATRIARRSGDGADRLEDAVRSLRAGIEENPWRKPYIAERLRRELGDQPELVNRVRGQSQAIDRALDILIRSATGLTAAQSTATSTKPRGVLFFAGPTGVGKTELAKALTQLLFDEEQERFQRFDMSEFSAEHSADRLIGSPPGYVGHDAGGELTNAIRRNPFSLVLFDEIEKAHHRILDKFLQVLDDGRLTDGRGETVYFTEAVIVFTSNLGVYVDEAEGSPAPALGAEGARRLNVTPEMERSEMVTRVESAIRDYFTRELERPELLNRLGDNIVVFDFISRGVGEEILDLMLANVCERVRAEQSLELKLQPAALQDLRSFCLQSQVLQFGGRGIGSELEAAFVNPLARTIFRDRQLWGDSAEVVAIARDNDRFTIEVRG